MKKGHEEFSKEFHKLRDELIEAICERMKELGCVKLKKWRVIPFMDYRGYYQSVEVKKLKYDNEGDVVVVSSLDNEWSLKEEGTVDGCIELLYYLEDGEYEIVKDKVLKERIDWEAYKADVKVAIKNEELWSLGCTDDYNPHEENIENLNQEQEWLDEGNYDAILDRYNHDESLFKHYIKKEKAKM